jgi:hypothetical protein
MADPTSSHHFPKGEDHPEEVLEMRRRVEELEGALPM